MIRINLLPQYIIEIRRVRALIIIFVVILLLEGGIVYKAYTGLQAQAAWFNNDKKDFVTRKATIDQEISTASTMETKSHTYEPYLSFFKRDSVIDYNQKIVNSLTEAGKMVSGGHGWFTNMTISGGNNVTYTGKINGLMNFLEFYFLMEDAHFDVAPAAQPAPSPDAPTMLSKDIDLTVTGTLQNKLPDLPALPDAVKTPNDLYIPSGGGAATTGAGTAGGKGAGGKGPAGPAKGAAGPAKGAAAPPKAPAPPKH